MHGRLPSPLFREPDRPASPGGAERARRSAIHRHPTHNGGSHRVPGSVFPAHDRNCYSVLLELASTAKWKGGRWTPVSVTMAAINDAGVTSNAGLYTQTPE